MDYDVNVFGTVAEWFSGVIAAIGIYLAIRQGKVKVKIKHMQVYENITVNIENKSNFEITVNNVYAYYYVKGFKSDPEVVYNMIDHQKSNEFKLKPKEVKTIDISNHLSKELIKNPYVYKITDDGPSISKRTIYIRYGCQYQGYLIKETKLLKKLKEVSIFEAKADEIKKKIEMKKYNK